MANYSNAEILAAWLLHATKVGPEGRLIPTETEITEILKGKPPHYEEALAIGEAYVKRVLETEPRSIVDASMGFVKEVNRLSEKFGGLLSAAPASAPRQMGPRR